MHRIVGIALGAVVTYLLLVILLGSEYSDRYLWAVVIGAIVALVWPWFIALVLARYVTNKRNEQIRAEQARVGEDEAGNR
jgi:preprotein translocase subunit SecF